MKKEKCEKCGITDGRVLVIHHKNRNSEDDSAENLQVLCSNCHKLQHLKRLAKERNKKNLNNWESITVFSLHVSDRKIYVPDHLANVGFAGDIPYISFANHFLLLFNPFHFPNLSLIAEGLRSLSEYYEEKSHRCDTSEMHIKNEQIETGSDA